MAAMSLLKILGNASKNSLALVLNPKPVPVTNCHCRCFLLLLMLRIVIRGMSDHRLMPIKPSRYHWERFKDLTHFYVLVGAIPAGALIIYCNLFIGPAKLAEIPEGYEPEEYEYHSHPITRFMAKHMVRSYQQEYEMFCQDTYEQSLRAKLNLAEQRIKSKMRENNDVQNIYYGPVTSRYHNMARGTDQRMAESGGRT
uniref:NADH dehydrogenase [ubiquinone] 1 beta subcomplex subunit 5, mitochondrial n=1 Tax=Alona affinis TaxID=381656 RepID=A0A9N6WU24_9CRUS|nr:EOG090X0FIE [Alona affinis]